VLEVASPPDRIATTGPGPSSRARWLSAIRTGQPPSGACPAIAMSPPSETRIPQPVRSAAAREMALELGATSVGRADQEPPESLDSAILFAPVGDLVPVALAALDRGGTLAVAGIHLSEIPALDYQAHLFWERQLRSVTANTRDDGESFLAEAAAIGIEVRAVEYPFEAADRALADLWWDRVDGVAVLTMG